MVRTLKATLYYTVHVHIAQTQTPTSYFSIGNEFESESSNVFKLKDINNTFGGRETLPLG